MSYDGNGRLPRALRKRRRKDREQRLRALEALAKPSEAVQAGYCPACMGYGTVNRVIPNGIEAEVPCSLCDGTGSWPPATTP